MTRILRKAVEYNVTEHCNLSCAGCDHASPLLPRRFAELDVFRRDLRALAEVLHCEELKLLGGEPLMHPKLIEFLKEGRASGISDGLTLVTNGVLLHCVDPAVFQLIDKLSVSLYPGIRVRVDYKELRKLAARYNFKLRLRRIRKFRRTLINSPHERRDVIRKIYRHCDLAHTWSCHTIHEGYYYKCPPAPFLEPRLAQNGVFLQNRAKDGVPIHGNPHLREELIAYLRKDEPLDACSYCLGSSGKKFHHYQLDRTEVREAITEEHARPSELIERNPIHIARRRLLRLIGLT